MPPHALQPKAYCTNPGLQSFLLAPPGVSTRDPSSERKIYLGEKWPVISTESCDIHAYTFGFFYMPQICDMVQTALLPFRRKACYGFFHPEKSEGFDRVWTRELGYQRPAPYLQTVEASFTLHILRKSIQISLNIIYIYRIFTGLIAQVSVFKEQSH